MDYCTNKLKHINNKLKDINSDKKFFFTQRYHAFKINIKSYSLSQ